MTISKSRYASGGCSIELCRGMHASGCIHAYFVKVIFIQGLVALILLCDLYSKFI